MHPSMAKSQESCGRVRADACNSPDAGPAHDSSSLFDEFTSENGNSDDLSFSTFVSEEGYSAGGSGTPDDGTDSISSSGFSSIASAESAAPEPEGPAGEQPWPETACTKVNTGFTTGNSNVIAVRETSLQRARSELESAEMAVVTKRHRASEDPVRVAPAGSACEGIGVSQVRDCAARGAETVPGRNLVRSKTVRSPNNELLYMENMKRVFLEARSAFPKADKMWFFEQFRWSWLSLFSRRMLGEDTVQRVVEQVETRRRREYSVLRRIVEGDEVSSRYMVLLVTQILPDGIEVFDGSYSVLCVPNPELSKKIISQTIKVGHRLRVFGAEYLLKEPVDFFSARGPVLRLFANGVRLAPDARRLGYQKRCAFLIKVCEISRHGGPVCGVDVSIKEVVESKVFLKCGNYKKMVEEDDVERELERMSALARSADADLRTEEIVVRRYAKMLGRGKRSGAPSDHHEQNACKKACIGSAQHAAMDSISPHPMAAGKRMETSERAPLDGTCFVFTGEMGMGRDEARSQVIMLGGRVTTQPTGKTTHVVVGADPGPSKMKRIRELGAKVLDEEGFRRLLDEALENFHDTFVVDAGTGLGNTQEPQRVQMDIWSEKWRPRSAEDFVGNRVIYTQLRNFLEGKTSARAALLSGPPGVGKTTMAHIVASELGIEVVEFNASDARSKGELSSRVGECINLCSFTADLRVGKRVVIMDEVDGMAADRGGIAELTRIIRGAITPIVCICNDRYHPKIRALAQQCMDLRFRRLESRQIIPRVRFILRKECRNLSDAVLNEIIQTSHGDMRYVLNTAQSFTARKTASHAQIRGLVKKGALKNIFELSTEMFHKKKITEKIDIYFEDYSFVPLMVQENYLKMSFRDMAEVRSSADAISLADTAEALIRGPGQVWTLAPTHAFLGSVLPTRNGFLMGRVEFSAYLGQGSKTQKNLRILSSIAAHSFRAMRAGRAEVRAYYIDIVFRRYVHELSSGRAEGCLGILEEYDLLKEDLESMAELVAGGVQMLKGIGTKAKAAVTRAYNKMQRTLPYTIQETERGGEDEGDESDDGQANALM
ncbi:UNVERIFIED_CONTAM: hypothetical protein PYX00_011298 [Menopon gallinae]|uniref:BRCT domain-containing protein n=1 Tax=Menopon gallinae TaxID=328185 RepID=A0AAW2H7B8_9NEOP